MKALIFDSGPLINFSINGFLPVLAKLKAKSKCNFFITSYVKQEVCDRPSRIAQFELGALRIHKLIDDGILELEDKTGVNPENLKQETQKLMSLANHCMKAEDQWIPLVSEAEMSCLALSNKLKEKNVENIVAVDERTARMLVEKPENLTKIISQHLHRPVTLEKDLREIKNINCIRSSELIYAAYKLGLIDLHSDKTLEALLYATKFKGTSISWEEINQLKKL